MEEMEKNELELTEQAEQTDSQEPACAEEVRVQTEDETDVQEEKAPKVKKQILSEILEMAETVVISVFAVLLLFTYLCRPVTVEGRSMNPTLLDADKLVMYRLFYQPTKGDIVVVRNDSGNLLSKDNKVISSGYGLDENIIKRVIAVAGDELMIDPNAGEVYINGELQDEPYINEKTMTNDGAFEYPITIPQGYIFVMGDNRNHSTDSRSSAVGLISVDDVIGKTYFRYFPLTEFGFVG